MHCIYVYWYLQYRLFLLIATFFYFVQGKNKTKFQTFTYNLQNFLLNVTVIQIKIQYLYTVYYKQITKATFKLKPGTFTNI